MKFPRLLSGHSSQQSGRMPLSSFVNATAAVVLITSGALMSKQRNTFDSPEDSNDSKLIQTTAQAVAQKNKELLQKSQAVVYREISFEEAKAALLDLQLLDIYIKTKIEDPLGYYAGKEAEARYDLVSLMVYQLKTDPFFLREFIENNLHASDPLKAHVCEHAVSALGWAEDDDNEEFFKEVYETSSLRNVRINALKRVKDLKYLSQELSTAFDNRHKDQDRFSQFEDVIRVCHYNQMYGQDPEYDEKVHYRIMEDIMLLQQGKLKEFKQGYIRELVLMVAMITNKDILSRIMALPEDKMGYGEMLKQAASDRLMNLK